MVLVSQVLSLLYIAALFIRVKRPDSKFVKTLATHGFVLAFIVATVATLGSLGYSDILGYTPCKFCWYQRIFMYPQVVLLGLALWRKDWNIYFYSLVLSIIGGLIALNHYILQSTGTSLFPCSAIGQNATGCSKVFVMHLGYITIPLMAFSAFLLMTLSVWLWNKERGMQK